MSDLRFIQSSFTGDGVFRDKKADFETTYILKKQMNTAVKNDSASEYMKPGSLKITSSAEMFIRSETDKTPRSKQNED